ncbi:MAG: hypothetical protein FWF81_08460 [Defluviitaleaceae bacterium]|nr:hypothetical protein [Defluviitaleaceae bacterium]
MHEYNVRGLVHDANFRVKLAKSLYWVPINKMGCTKYKNAEFTSDSFSNIYYAKNIVSNPYEAFQYLNAIGFKETKDVYYETEGETEWEHHIDGYTAIANRRGCCTSVAAAISVLLDNKFEKMGYIFFIRPDTSNHALNYVYMNEKFYIFDSSAFVYGDMDVVAIESGDLHTIKNKIITSICMEVSQLEDFVQFHKRIHLYNNHKFLYFAFPQAKKCIDRISLKKEGKTLHVRFPLNAEFKLLNDLDESLYLLDFA